MSKAKASRAKSGKGQKGKQEKTAKLSKWWLLPLVLAIVVIPLITVIHIYDCGLEENPWFSIGGRLNDFFLYYKAFFLRLIGVVVLFSLAFLVPFGDNLFLKEKKTIAPTVAIGVFGLVSLLSAILSAHKMDAFFGGYEQFEGWFVLLTYVVCFYMAFGFVRTKELIRFLLDALLIGATVIGVLGTFQAMGLDWIQSEWAKPILAPELAGQMDLKDLNISLNFGKGMSYVTLYNPNYVGSYVALVLPYCGYLILRGEKLWRRSLAAVCSILLIVTLLASRSLTGILGLMIGGMLLMILLIPYWKKAKPVLFAGLTIFVAGTITIVALQPGFFSKLFGGSEEYAIRSVVCEDQTIRIHTGKDQDIVVSLDKDAVKNDGWTSSKTADKMITITGADGSAIESYYDSSENSLMISKDGYSPLKFRMESMELTDNSLASYRQEVARVTGHSEELTVDSESGEASESARIDVLHLIDWQHEWRLTTVDGRLMIFNDFGRLDELKEIPEAGFKNSYYFASRRGYIWSRTFPLLTDHLLIGAGADNFVYEFPNDDYIGKRYMGYDTQTITKPHDMFLQIWVQDGLLSLVAFLFLYILFLVRAFRMCFGKDKAEAEKGIGFHGFTIVTAVAATGYIIVGFANDSTITVAPLYWILLGAGYAAEAMCRQNTENA